MSVSSKIVSEQDAKLITKAVVGPDVSVLNFSLKPYSEEKLGFLGAHCRLRIEIKHQNNEDDTDEILCFVKALPLDCAPQLDYVQESTAFEKEAAFYSKIVPQLIEGYSGPEWCPRAYLVKDDMLCFEDLGLQGFGMRDKLFNKVLVRSTLRAIASLHASSIKAEAKLGMSVKEVCPDFFYELLFIKQKKIYKWFNSGVQVAVALAEEMGLDTARLPEAFETLYKAIIPSKVKINVVSHGDLWANNILFDENDQCRLVDFQLFRYCPPGLDLAQFLYLCAPNELRKTKEKELLRYYHDHLLEFLEDQRSKAPSFQEVCLGYEERKIAGAITAVLYFPQALMGGATSRDLVDNSDTFDQYVIGDRRAIVLANMKKDRIYKERIEAAVRELVEMSFKLNQLPQPC